MTQDKRQDLCQRWMGFSSVLGCLQGVGAVCLPEQIKDCVVTAGHLGRDGDLLLLLLTMDSSCWTRKTLGMGNQCLTEDG